jgi:U3 small nucleolar RNA-associated protein 19
MPPPSSLPPVKKRKTVARAAENEGVVENIATIEGQLTDAISTAGSLNALVDLVQIARTEDASVLAMSKAIYALYRVYVLLLNSGKLNPGGDQAAKTARTWIWEQLNTYTDILCGLLQDDDKMLWVNFANTLSALKID